MITWPDTKSQGPFLHFSLHDVEEAVANKPLCHECYLHSYRGRSAHHCVHVGELVFSKGDQGIEAQPGELTCARHVKAYVEEEQRKARRVREVMLHCAAHPQGMDARNDIHNS